MPAALAASNWPRTILYCFSQTTGCTTSVLPASQAWSPRSHSVMGSWQKGSASNSVFSRANSLSLMLFCTTSRVWAVQIWPPLVRKPFMAVSTAASMSTSSKMTSALFPPSSSIVGASFSAQLAMTLAPVAEEPVKETILTSSCLDNASPAAGPPVTMLSTPLGRPASMQAWPMNMQESPAISDGFNTAELPATRAGATLRKATFSG
mmetsp:Transcript_81743/g.264870  ORF Transcript_81743/g.264870 Transcript_81743/m.264870 type:complete len:207 (-) Transcript_81743:549-1169(-)